MTVMASVAGLFQFLFAFFYNSVIIVVVYGRFSLDSLRNSEIHVILKYFRQSKSGHSQCDSSDGEKFNVSSVILGPGYKYVQAEIIDI